MTSRIAVGTLLLVSLAYVGCSSKTSPERQLKTSPVTGVVHVDGEPAKLLTIVFHPETGSSDLDRPIAATTLDGGKFSVGTYKPGDGLPAGTYNMVFKWEAVGIRKDRLKGAYKDAYSKPQTSKHQVTVFEGEPKEIGIIELSTKGHGK